MTPFWQYWIKATCGTLGLLGLILAGGAIDATAGPARLYFQLVGDSAQLDLNPHMQFTLGVLGGVCIGWSITFFATFQAAHELQGEAAAKVWRLTLIGLTAWYIVDSTLSVVTGFWGNAVVNTLFFASLVYPIIRADVLKPA
jgi:hypothetical protein